MGERKRTYTGKGLLSSLQSHFKNQAGGRYMSLLLRELGRVEPACFADLLSQKNSSIPSEISNRIRAGEAQFETEWHYDPSSGANRRADLAVLIDGSPALLIEVKQDDINATGNDAQFQCYVDHVSIKRNKTWLVYISRYQPKENILRNICKYGTDVRYLDIARTLSRHESRPFAGMLLDYLEDMGVTKYITVDLKKEDSALKLMLVQLIGFPHQHGLGKLYSESAAARTGELIQTLRDNIAVIGERAASANRTVCYRKPTCRFYIDHYVKRTSKSSAFDDDGDPSLLRAKAKEKGYVYFYALQKLTGENVGGDNWLNWEYGLCFGLAKAGDIELFAYSSINWRGLNDSLYAKLQCERYPSEDELTKLISQCTKAALQDAKRLSGFGTYLKVCRTLNLDF